MALPVLTKEVKIEERQYMPFPENKQLVVGGPAIVETTRYDDGSLRVRILDGKPSPVELAIAQKWKRMSYQV